MKFFQNSILEKNKKLQKGFSIAEAMFACFVLSAGLVAVAGLIYGSITNSIDSRNHIIASELAQEGIELARNSIDNERIKNDPPTFIPATWPSSDSKNCTTNFFSELDKSPSLSCGSNISYDLYLNTLGYYTTNSSGTTPTRFKRGIFVDYDSNSKNDAKMVTIISLVSWGTNNLPSAKNDCNSRNKCVYVETILRSWNSY